MATNVISHRKPRRKRGGWLSWAGRRFGALAVTLAALAGVAWVAPRYLRGPMAPPPAPIEAAAPLAPYPLLTPPPTPAPATVRQARARHARPGVPLDAHAGDPFDDFEILNAGELASISQAHEGDRASQFALDVQAATTPSEAY